VKIMFEIKWFGKAEDGDLRAQVVEVEKVQLPKEKFDNAVQKVVDEYTAEAIKEALARFIHGNEAYDQTIAAEKQYPSYVGNSLERILDDYPLAVFMAYPTPKVGIKLSIDDLIATILKEQKNDTD